MGVIRNSMHDFVISPPPSPSPIKGEGITVISTGMTPPPYRSNLAESPGRAGGLPHRITRSAPQHAPGHGCQN